MKQHMERVQAGAAIAIIAGFYVMAMLPAVLKAFSKVDVEFDPGMVETSKNAMLILIGYLFGSAVRRDGSILQPAQAPPGFVDTLPTAKDMTK